MKWKTDPQWKEALGCALLLSHRHRRVVVPEEFFSERSNFWPLGKARLLQESEITGFVIEKDKCKCFRHNFWRDENFSRYHCVFANETFVGFSALEEDAAGDQDQIRIHLPAFMEFRTAILKQGTEQEPLPYLLDTQQNRILQTMFPDKRYVFELFRDLSREPSALREEVFRYCVNLVNLEISGFCNRSCSYCPVKDEPRRKDKNRKIPWDLYTRTIDDLERVHYSGILSFVLFNEPLADRPLLLRCLSHARKRLPDCRIRIPTNGDFLTPDYLRELADAGLDELTVSVHYDGYWNRERQLDRIKEILRRIELEDNGFLTQTDGRIIYYADTTKFSGTRLSYIALRTENFAVYGNDRGGLLQEGVCKENFWDHCEDVTCNTSISYDGTIVPCCNMFGECERTHPWTYGNLGMYPDIFSAFSCRKAAAFRRGLFAPRKGKEYTPPPCLDCSIADMDGNARLFRLDDVRRREIRDCWLAGGERGGREGCE